ncbi:hypothetical protein ACRE_044370 [Hapsidospora chrysogenum ATCC 11550]|uniref:Uncharacterized protein n=1 Tax=Hapsidospora chrysogenum (strain ATCC 11550 / CBS 779.69 / DSM 880 / IAM 14645 / JCM 23072 / IMI 49137) TaxID=857340 RepID=A0A086T5S5_HAPC1|nr:hypothetical protein ACRE_044370 [Hapsidospora chrysogenum ATCC 11550]
MLSFAPSPIFAGSWDHRPAVSSPLSSSPARGSSPLSPIDRNTLPQRQVQSSPIQPPKFKFSTRPTRPNPVVRRREETQEQRRKNFLQNVRQKSEDKGWERRNIEGQFLRTSYLNHLGQLTFDAPEPSEGDIEDAMTFQSHAVPPTQDGDVMTHGPPDEEEELEAMIASYEEQQAAQPLRPRSPAMSDEDYDDIFAELLAQEQPAQQQQAPSSADHMDEDHAMSF